VIELEGVSPGHRVACHWAEEIERGELQRHDIDPELVEAGRARTGADDGSPFGPASVTEI
jgi:peptide/nickel transport system ATP-binding protein